MKETLKSIKVMDGLILGMAIWILMGIDFDAMSIIDKVYLVTFTIWIVLFAVRLVLVYQRTRREST